MFGKFGTSRFLVRLVVAMAVITGAVALATAPSSAKAEPPNSNARIIGGGEAEVGEYPFMASLDNTSDPDYSHDCGGFLVHPEYVLTAAHCTIGINPADLELSIGRHNRLDDEQGVPRVALDILYHPLADGGVDYDFSVIRIDPVTSIAPLQLALSPEAPPLFAEAVIAGWGVTESESAPEVLHKATVPLHDDEKCGELLDSSAYVDLIMLCASGEGVETCNGDSGGPIFVETHHGPVAIGVTSWGFTCADSLSVFTQLYGTSSIPTWLNETIPNLAVPVLDFVTCDVTQDPDTGVVTVEASLVDGGNIASGSIYINGGKDPAATVVSGTGTETVAFTHTPVDGTFTYGVALYRDGVDYSSTALSLPESCGSATKGIGFLTCFATENSDGSFTIAATATQSGVAEFFNPIGREMHYYVNDQHFASHSIDYNFEHPDTPFDDLTRVHVPTSSVDASDYEVRIGSIGSPYSSSFPYDPCDGDIGVVDVVEPNGDQTHTLSVKVLLGGAVDDTTINNPVITAKMRSGPDEYADLDLSDPYGSDVEISPEVLDGTGIDQPVDWVRVDLIRPAGENAGTVVQSHSAIVLVDGRVVDPLTGGPIVPPNFEAEVQDESFMVSVRHRNHVAGMSRSIFVDGQSVDVDLTTAKHNQGVSHASQVQMGLIWAMIPANPDQSTNAEAFAINSNDEDIYNCALQNSSPVLVKAGDFNLDGNVTSADHDLWVQFSDAATFQIPGFDVIEPMDHPGTCDQAPPAGDGGPVSPCGRFLRSSARVIPTLVTLCQTSSTW